jgi:hypothetical protein
MQRVKGFYPNLECSIIKMRRSYLPKAEGQREIILPKFDNQEINHGSQNVF